MKADNLSLNGLAARASEQKTDNEENIERVYTETCVYTTFLLTNGQMKTKENRQKNNRKLVGKEKKS